MGSASHSNTSQTKSHTTSVKLGAELVSKLEDFCQQERISMFSMALSVLHRCMRAYSHNAFAVGVAVDTRPYQFRDTVGMFVNTILVPFVGGKDGGKETVQALHKRWTREILPHSSTPYDLVTSMGYGCNIYLAFNVGFGDRTVNQNTHSDDDSCFEYDSSIAEHTNRMQSKFDLSVSWSEAPGNGKHNNKSRGLTVSFESGLGQWPHLEDRFLYILNALLCEDQ